jgi:hypothetical protein
VQDDKLADQTPDPVPWYLVLWGISVGLPMFSLGCACALLLSAFVIPFRQGFVSVWKEMERGLK